MAADLQLKAPLATWHTQRDEWVALGCELGLLVGSKRQSNVFWQLLDVASKPALWLTRRVSPKLILDQHIPLAAGSWLIIAWVLVVMAKIDLCLQVGAAACQ